MFTIWSHLVQRKPNYKQKQQKFWAISFPVTFLALIEVKVLIGTESFWTAKIILFPSISAPTLVAIACCTQALGEKVPNFVSSLVTIATPARPLENTLITIES